jgi:sugar phosphate isomerase/epimerase
MASEIHLGLADHAFPAVTLEASTEIARAMGFQAIEISLFSTGGHLQPREAFASPDEAAARIRSATVDHGMEIIGLFLIEGATATERALNHPDPATRGEVLDDFGRLIDLAVACGINLVTILPGVEFPGDPPGKSFSRAVEQLTRRVAIGNEASVAVAVEAGWASVVRDPADARRLLDAVPGLGLALDQSHFAYMGHDISAFDVLVDRAAVVHLRGGGPHRLQAPLALNEIDFGLILKSLNRVDYHGFGILEYVCLDHVWLADGDDSRTVDVVSESLKLREHLRAATQNVHGCLLS